jgi:hypothetical protein
MEMDCNGCKNKCTYQKYADQPYRFIDLTDISGAIWRQLIIGGDTGWKIPW